MSAIYLGTLAALLGVMVALYLLRPPPRRWVMPSNLLWEQVLQRTRTTIDRWRWWVSLLLAWAIACLLATALLPSSMGGVPGGGRLLLIVDDTATMAARTSDGRDRFRHAVTRARALIQQNSSILVTDTAHLLPTPAFADRTAAVVALEQLHVSVDAVPQFPDVAQVTTDPMLVHAVFITDGVGIPVVPAGIEVVSVFEPAFNVGITAFDVKTVPGDGRRAQALVEVGNAVPEAVVAEIEITDRNGHRAQARVSAGPLQSMTTLIDVSEFAAGPLAARVRSVHDALAIDDLAYAWRPTRRTLRVGLVTPGSDYLDKVLRSMRRVQLSVMRPAEYRAAAPMDLWVFDRFSPRDAPSQPLLSFQPPPASWLPRRLDERSSPVVHGWNIGHPVLEKLNLDDVLVDHALPFAPSDTTVLLKSARDAPLIVAREGSPRRVLVAFALEDSNFPLAAEFPIFIANCLDWLNAEPATRAQRLGPVVLPAQGARVVGMDGKKVSTFAAPLGTVFDASEPGIFTAVTKDSIERVVINVFNSHVTQINDSRLSPTIEEQPVEKYSIALPVWRLCLILALVLLLVEWWTWNRRLTV